MYWLSKKLIISNFSLEMLSTLIFSNFAGYRGFREMASIYVLCFPFQQPPKKTSKREKPKQKATSKSKKTVKSANVKKADSSTTKKNQNSSKKGRLEMTPFQQL